MVVSKTLVSKFQVGLKSLLRKGLSEPLFYGDLVYKLKIVGSNKFHTGQCKSTGGCYNELVVAYFGAGGGVKWRKR